MLSQKAAGLLSQHLLLVGKLKIHGCRPIKKSD
jgi:hypothetical protein